MKIISLELKNFRNYRSEAVEFGDGLNILFGKNASGKTNLLESVYVCSVLSSPRAVKDKEMILFGQDRAQIKIVVEKKYRKHTVFLQIDSQNAKKVQVDGIPVARAGELLGILGIVFFSPDELKLVKDAPAERRRFLDVALSQQQKLYYAALSKYNRILSQKNKLIKDSRDSQNINEMLDVWDTGLAECGSLIIERRMEYIKALSPLAAHKHGILSGDSELLSLSYDSGVSLQGDLKENLLIALRNSREKDKKLGFSSVGPHRDDIEIILNDLDARRFASQGQQRTVALSMKLAEAEQFCAETGEPPVLLLDDVLSELDVSRQTLLLKELKGVQTILTCTEYNLNLPAKLLHVDNGKIV